MLIPDQKVYMMDAGIATVNSDGSFGDVIGQVKANLKPFGDVYRVSETDGGKFDQTISPDALPPTTGDCDLFMDYSTIFRRRYISAKVEYAGENKYAIRIKEGNRNSPLRDFTMLAIAAYGAIVLLMGIGIIKKVIGIFIIIAGLYLWILPSDKSVSKAKSLIQILAQ